MGLAQKIARPCEQIEKERAWATMTSLNTHKANASHMLQHTHGIDRIQVVMTRRAYKAAQAAPVLPPAHVVSSNRV